MITISRKEYMDRYLKEYIKRPKYKEWRKNWQHKYDKTPQRKEFLSNYQKTQKWKDYLKIYRQTEKYKEYQKQYRQTDKCKRTRLKDQTMRDRRLGFIPIMDNPFPKEINIEWHHINDLLVIPSPKTIHKSSYKSSVDEHRNICDEKLRKIGFDFSMFKK